MLTDAQIRLQWKLLRQCGSDQDSLSALPLAEINAHLDEELKAAAEKSLHSFVRQAWHVLEPGKPFIDNWHVGAMAEHLEAVSLGQLKRLVITIPPRMSKTTIVSVCWPSWDWITRPSRQWLCFAHSDDKAIEDTRRMRMLVQSQWYQAQWQLSFSKDENKKSSFLNDAMGQRIAVGILSQFQGVNADIEIFDDAVDNKQANSPIKMEAALTTYREQALTRLNSEDSAIVAIGQRLGVKDFIGYLLDADYAVLNIPMRYERNHPHATTTKWQDPRTREGELICPERFSEEYVSEQEKPNNLGAFGVSSQFQQRPFVRGGQMIRREWFEIVAAAPRKSVRCRYWDTAGTDEAGCSTVGLRMSVSDGVYYIEAMAMRQVSFFKRHRLMKQVATLDAEIDQSTEQVIERQGGSGGKEAAMHEVRLLAGFAVYIDNPVGKGDKDRRLVPFAAQAEAGNIKLVKGKWNEAFLDAMESLRPGMFVGRDIPDATAGAFNWLTRDNGPANWSQYEILASNGSEDERQPFSEKEEDELPAFLKDLIINTRMLTSDRDN